MTTPTPSEVERVWEEAKDQQNDWFYGMSIEHRQLFCNWLTATLTAQQTKHTAELEAKAISVREEEAVEYNKIIDDLEAKHTAEMESLVREIDKKVNVCKEFDDQDYFIGAIDAYEMSKSIIQSFDLTSNL